MAYVCVHAHFYQPSREDPFTGTWPAQPSAAPYRDWNERIADECYGPVAHAELWHEDGSVRAVRNLYADLSFDVGPTLLHWLEHNAPNTYDAILTADAQADKPAMAQGYHHAILPLASPRDRRTEIAWGLADFQRRFGRRAEGFWLPETAVDVPTLCDLADHGVRFVVLGPHQIATVQRPHATRWTDAREHADLTSRAYLIDLPGDRQIAAIPFDATLARGVAFEGWLHDGEAMGRRLQEAAAAAEPNALIHFATDGESYGHHHRKGEMGLARALEVLHDAPGVQVVSYATYLREVPPTWRATVAERTSWSCAHGVERWRSDCDCARQDTPGWHLRWRAPLRAAFDQLRDAAHTALNSQPLFVSRDDARNTYVDVLHQPEHWPAWCEVHVMGDRQQARAAMEIERHLLAVYTSCAWFFEDATRIEARQNLRHAARAMALLHKHFGLDLLDGFTSQIAALPANAPTQVLVDVLTAPRDAPRLPGRREAGLLCHVSALPGSGPIGDLDAAIDHIDWMVRAGLSVWQVLPLCPVGPGGSPYSSGSSLSGDPRLIGLAPLVQAGLLSEAEAVPPPCALDRIDDVVLHDWKLPALRRAAHRLCTTPSHPWRARLERFVRQHPWEVDAALFFALADEHDGAPWWTWPDALRDRDPGALEQARATHHDAICTWTALAYLFHRQWEAVHAYARIHGVQILGDLPIYVGHDSVDVWANPEVFQLERGVPAFVAGVPPDAFSELGQRWGNPIYDWKALADADYAWWQQRLARAFTQTDRVRLDHFIGFVRYWSIPGDAPDATTGTWEEGPGLAFFEAMQRQLGTLPLVVEDLGCMDAHVREVQTTLGYPGMRVMQFGFDGNPDNEHLPEHHPAASVAYVGTHDNDTAAGWFNDLSVDERERVLARVAQVPVWTGMNALLLGSPAALAVLNPQDLLGLGSHARFNVPGTVTDNWRWRLRPDALTDALATSLNEQIAAAGRASANPRHERT